MSSDVNETTKRKRDSPDENLESDPLIIQQDEKSAPPSKRAKSESDSSDSDCISQEDLLAQLGLNSVKKLQAEEPNSKKVVYPEPPKQSILEFLSSPNVSKKVEPSAQPPKEKPLTNGCMEEDEDGEEECDGEDIDKKEKFIVHLQNNLRNEEAKLLLLRKLYACQNDKAPTKDASPTPARVTPVTTATTTQAQASAAAGQSRKAAQVAGTTQKHQQTTPSTKVQSPTVHQPRVVFLTQPRGQPVVIAPKLVPVSTGKPAPLRDTTGRNIRPLHVSVAQNSKATSSPLNSATKVIPRPQAVHHTAVYAQSSVATTVNKSTAQRGISSAHVSNDKMRPSENGLPKSAASLNVLHSPSPPQQSHGEAKLALRKQLERTLLQIPLPKPPVQDWNFVPSVNTQDFTILVGLEGVVSHILESKEISSKTEESKVEAELIPPKFCSECDTDFTPGWRTKKLEDDSKVTTLCEMCFTQKIKKTLKAEHTSRLKAAFVKALKQEQEVEQKFQASGGATKGKADGARSSTHHQIPSLQATRVVYHPSVHHSLQPQVFQPHHSIVHQLQQQQLQQQHQEIDGGHHQETRYFTYVGQHNCQPQHKQRHNYTSGDHDRQREYLLDMIPSGHNSRGYRI